VEKIFRQKSHKNFSGKFGEIRAKILRTPENMTAPHLCSHTVLVCAVEGQCKIRQFCSACVAAIVYCSQNNKYEDGLGPGDYFDANEFVDAILKVVCDCARDRRVIFSSFDVDICIM